MIAIDPSSFLNLMEDLSLFYEDPEISFSRPPNFLTGIKSTDGP